MSWWNSQPELLPNGMESTNPFGNYTVVDAAPKDLLYLVHPHWYQFPPMNPLWYGLLGFVIFIIGSCAFVGNAAVIYIFMNTPSLRSPANLLVVNLAVSDFLMITCMFPPMVINCYYHTWAFSPVSCQLYGFIGSMFGCISIWTMIFITADRYNVIVKGMSAAPLSKNGALARIGAAWGTSFLWGIMPFFGWNKYVPEGNLTACGTDYLTQTASSKSYLYIYGSFVWLCPLIIVIAAYSQIVKAVVAHEQAMREQAQKMGVKSLRNEETQKTTAECKLAKVALMNVSLWFIAWTPYCVINFCGMEAPSVITPLFTIWGSLFAKCNAVYNPIIYAISHPKYKLALEEHLPFLCKKELDIYGPADGSEATSTTSEPVTEKTEKA